MKAINWIIGWLIIVLTSLFLIAIVVIDIDPYFHYHKPKLDKYFYSLDNQRSQNDGIIKHFDYDALIIGTSMTENFKTSEMNNIFNVKSIKVPFFGATYKEINDNLYTALDHNPNIKKVIRGLDYNKFIEDKNYIRRDLGKYPTYLYDNKYYNDVNYLFNKDVIFNRVYKMQSERKDIEFKPGITSFDDYSNWQNDFGFGRKNVLPNGILTSENSDSIHLSEKDKKVLYENIIQNVTSIADKYPDVDFYYFFTPYSAVYWSNLNNEGKILEQIEAEKYTIELILEHSNIHLFSFNNCVELTTDLNNYKDSLHYAEWINSLILQWIYDGRYKINKSNYLDYLNKEFIFYSNFDYSKLNNQIDYEDDYKASEIIKSKYVE